MVVIESDSLDKYGINELRRLDDILSDWIRVNTEVIKLTRDGYPFLQPIACLHSTMVIAVKDLERVRKALARKNAP